MYTSYNKGEERTNGWHK